MERGGGSVFEAPMLFIARVPKRGALPRLRCLVKPPPMHLNRRLSYPLRAHPRPIRNPTQNCTNQAQPRHRKPPPSCSELQYGGGFTYAPLRAHPQQQHLFRELGKSLWSSQPLPTLLYKR